MNRRLIFDPDTHTYRVDGEIIPSATQLARFCFADMDKSRPWAAEEAADRGTRVHQYCMLLDYGAIPDAIDADCAGCLKAYQRFLRDYRPDWLEIECSGWRQRADASEKFAGTIDRFGKIDGRPCILDIKTGALHDAALRVQLTAYLEILLDRLPEQCADLYALKLSRDGTYFLKRVSPDWELLDACITLDHALQKRKKEKQ